MSRDSLRSNHSLPDNFDLNPNHPFRSRPRSCSRLVSRNRSSDDNNNMAENFQINPFIGDFNPGTVQGQKLFEKKTKGVSDDNCLGLTKKDGPAF